MRDLTTDETDAIYALTDAELKFRALPEVHEDDDDEFMDAIHHAYNIIAARPVVEITAPRPEPESLTNRWRRQIREFFTS